MKKSANVVLSFIFLAAVSSVNARAQDVVRPGNEPGNGADSTGSHHHRYRSHGGHGFLGIFGRHRNQTPATHPATPLPTTGPRTNGFGNSMNRTAHS